MVYLSASNSTPIDDSHPTLSWRLVFTAALTNAIDKEPGHARSPRDDPEISDVMSRQAALRVLAGGSAIDLGLVADLVAAAGVWNTWQYCKRCRGPVYVGGLSIGVCPAGGGHDGRGSFNYSLEYT